LLRQPTQSRSEGDIAGCNKEGNIVGVATQSDASIASPSGSLARDRERSNRARGPGLPGSNGRANGVPSFPEPQIVGVAAGAAAGGEHGIALEDVGGARLFVSDARVALMLLDEARYRAVRRLFGVSRDQSWLVTLIALVLIAEAANAKWDQMVRGPGGPTKADVALGAAALRELLTAISGPSSRDTPLVGTLVSIAVLGALVRPGLRRTVHGIRASSHRVRHSFNHRYGHLLPMSATGRQRLRERPR